MLVFILLIIIFLLSLLSPFPFFLSLSLPSFPLLHLSSFQLSDHPLFLICILFHFSLTPSRRLCLSIYLSINLSAYLSICIYLSSYLFIKSMYLSLYCVFIYMRTYQLLDRPPYTALGFILLELWKWALLFTQAIMRDHIIHAKKVFVRLYIYCVALLLEEW